VINNIAYYPLQCARNSGPVLTAFLNSCRAAGINPVQNSLDCDAVVIWSVLWNGRMAENEAVYRHYRSLNKPVFVIDVGALKRGVTWKIALNNINALGDYGNGFRDPDRPRKLGIALKNRAKTNENIIVATQHIKSEQVAHIDYKNWPEQMVRNIYNTVSDRLVLIRHHPRCPMGFDGAEIEVPQKLPGTYDDFDINFGCHAMVNFNSGPAIQAAIAGCPIVCDKTSLAYPVSIKLEELENPPEKDRSEWLIDICHTEYTVDEIESGLWLKNIRESIKT